MRILPVVETYIHYTVDKIVLYSYDPDIRLVRRARDHIGDTSWENHA